jgi:hypothetical protein
VNLIAGFVAPPVTQARWGVVGLNVVFFALLAVAVGWALHLAWRERDLIPVVVCVGGLVAVLNEPIYDLLGQLVYAHNQPILFTSFGNREIPILLIPAYVVWVSGLGLVFAQVMKRGATPRLLWIMAGCSFLSVVTGELAGNSSHLWTYYGQAPAKFLVVAPQMAPVPLVSGYLIHHFRTRLRGPGVLLFLAVPGMALAATYAATSWPIYLALNSDVPVLWNWVAAAATLALCATVVWAVANVFEEVPAQGVTTDAVQLEQQHAIATQEEMV